MILYHGSNIEIMHIDLNKCRPYKDFGKGFYLTTIKEQAFKMAVRTSGIYGGTPIVTAFEFNQEACCSNGAVTKVFEKPDTEWAHFVINNRNRHFSDYGSRNCSHDNKYDIVIGPVANDDLALLFRQFSRGMIDEDYLLKNMIYKKLTDQYSFHTEVGIKHLTKAGIANG